MVKKPWKMNRQRHRYIQPNILGLVLSYASCVLLFCRPKRCIKMSARITPTLPSPLRGGGLGWGGKGHRR